MIDALRQEAAQEVRVPCEECAAMMRAITLCAMRCLMPQMRVRYDARDMPRALPRR